MRRTKYKSLNKDRKIEKVLIIDYSNLMHRTIFNTIKDDKYNENDYALWKSRILTGKYPGDGIFGLMLKHKPDRLILAIDSRKSWRHDIFSDYKNHRALERKKSKVDFDSFFPMAEKFLEELTNIFKNVITIQVDNTEADDIIAVLGKEVHNDCEYIIASNDKDFHQLTKYKHIKQYDPLNKEFKNITNPEMELRLKIILGDRNDGIMQLKNGVGKVNAAKILKNGLSDFLDAENLHEKYNQNKILIDFDCIPEDIKDKIIKEYKEIELGEINRKDFFNFFIKNKIAGIAGEFTQYSKHLETLI